MTECACSNNEYVDRVANLPRYGFANSNLEGKVVAVPYHGPWVDVHEVTAILKEAQEEINRLRKEVGGDSTI